MSLSAILIIALGLILMLDGPMVQGTQDHISGYDLNTLRALTLIDGIPEELAEEKYFKTLYRK